MRKGTPRWRMWCSWIRGDRATIVSSEKLSGRVVELYTHDSCSLMLGVTFVVRCVSGVFGASWT
jgi:hypothetical protein